MNGDDKRLSELIDEVDHVATTLRTVALHVGSSRPVLLLGPRHSGAGFLAESLHACSRRRERPFVRARCGLYSGMLLEAQLFGRSNPRNGYLRSILSRRRGLLGTADGGTLFVEQIQNTSAGVQARLVELMTSGEYSDFEQTSTYSADVRLIASARGDLGQRVKKGLFLPELLAELRPMWIDLRGGCATRESILHVIEWLRAESAPPAPGGNGRMTRWCAQAARRATQTPASAALREAAEVVARRFPQSTPVEPVFLGVLEYLSRQEEEARSGEVSGALEMEQGLAACASA